MAFPSTNLLLDVNPNLLDGSLSDGATVTSVLDGSGNSYNSISVSNVTFNRQAYDGKSTLVCAPTTGTPGSTAGGANIDFGAILNGTWTDLIIFHCAKWNQNYGANSGWVSVVNSANAMDTLGMIIYFGDRFNNYGTGATCLTKSITSGNI